jgi:type I restriction enzyme S subunit
MNKNNKHTLIPKLRFPEFQNDGEWEVKKLGKILVKYNEKVGLNRKDKYVPVSVGELGLRDRNTIFGKELTTNTENYKIFPYASICFGLGSKSLAVAVNDIVKGQFSVSAAYKIFKIENIVNPTYFAYYINFVKHILGSRILIQSSRQGKNIDESILLSTDIPLPSLPEQEKIASCLSSLDEIITAQTQKIEQLQRHKKGLLQGLFPNINNE